MAELPNIATPKEWLETRFLNSTRPRARHLSNLRRELLEPRQGTMTTPKEKMVPLPALTESRNQSRALKAKIAEMEARENAVQVLGSEVSYRRRRRPLASLLQWRLVYPPPARKRLPKR